MSDSGTATRVKRPLLAESVNARQDILAATAFLLRYRGYKATTTRAIAAEVGIKAGSIFHYFPTKDAIVGEVVSEGVRVVFDAVTSALAALPPEAGPRERLQEAIKIHLLSSLEHSDYTSASIRAFTYLPPAVKASCGDERRRYENIWRTLVGDLRSADLLQPGVSDDSVRLLVLGAVNWAGEWYKPGRIGIDKLSHDFAACIVK